MVKRRKEDARNVQCDVSLSHDHSMLSALQIWLQVLKLGQSIVPAHECSRREDSFQILARYAQSPVLICAVRKQHSIVVRLHLEQFDVVANAHIANVVEARRLRHFFEGVLTILDLWMVWCHAKSHEAVWHRQLLVHVDNGILDFVQEAMCCVEAGRTRAYDGYTQAFSWEDCGAVCIALDGQKFCSCIRRGFQRLQRVRRETPVAARLNCAISTRET